MDIDIFSKAVERALEELPEAFKQTMDNLEVLVEDFPDRETLRSLGIASKWDLLGLYVGVPVTERSVFAMNPYPERIFLYRLPIIRVARTGRSLTRVIREVVIHEVGHHFGFDDAQLDEMIGRHE